MIYVDYKTTIWQRMSFSDDTKKEEIIRRLKEEGLDNISEEELGFIENKILYETEERLTPDENNGCSTVEVLDENNRYIYDNNKLKG